MRKVLFALIALAISLFGTQCWAQENCSPGVGNVSCTFSPGNTRGVFDFTATGDGRLVVQFDTVVTTFTLTVNVNHDQPVFAEGAFPGATCVPYGAQNGGQCDQYDFKGTGGHGVNGMPVRPTDYKRLITLTLSYFAPPLVGEPAFGHAPGDGNTIFSEDILTSYSSFPPCTVLNGCINTDPTMSGQTPGLSRVVALNKPLAESGDTFCLVSPHENDTFTVGQQIEVEFRLFAGGVCPNTSGTPLSDKTARLSVSTLDGGGNAIFPRLRNKEQGNRFHFDRKEGVNEFDLSTHKLLPGRYTITIISSKFSSQDVDVNIIAGTDTDDDPD